MSNAMCSPKPFDYNNLGSVKHYCTLFDRVKIKIPTRAKLFFDDRETVKKKCRHCKNQFEAANGKVLFCSEQCLFEARSSVCVHCGVKFLSSNNQKGAKFCSKAHANAHNKPRKKRGN